VLESFKIMDYSLLLSVYNVDETKRRQLEDSHRQADSTATTPQASEQPSTSTASKNTWSLVVRIMSAVVRMMSAVVRMMSAVVGMMSAVVGMMSAVVAVTCLIFHLLNRYWVFQSASWLIFI